MLKEFRSRIRVGPMVVIVGFALALVGCNGDDNGIIDDDDGAIRFIHAVPGAPAIDVYRVGDDDPIVENLIYGLSSEFQTFDTGLYEFEIREAGTSPTADPLLRTEPIDIFDEDRFSAVIAGDAEGLRTILVAQDFDRDDDAFVNIVHASPDAPAVDLDVGDDGTIDIENLEQFTALPQAVQVPDQEFQVAVFAEGERVTSFTLPNIDDGDEFLVVAVGFVGEQPQAATGFNLLLVDEGSEVNIVAQDPTVFVVHAVSDAPAVDVRLINGFNDNDNGNGNGNDDNGNDDNGNDDNGNDDNGNDNDNGLPNEVLGLEFATISGPIQVSPGEYDANVFLAGTQQQVFDADIPDLGTAQRYLLVLAGNVGDDDLELVTLGDNFDLEIEEPRVRLLHASPDAPSVDVSVVEDGSLSPPAIAQDLDFAETPPDEGAPVPAGAQTLGIAPSGEVVPVATFDVEVSEAARLFAIVAGALAPVEGEQPLQLFVIDSTIFPWELDVVEAGGVVEE
jgi:hypothetical protein